MKYIGGTDEYFEVVELDNFSKDAITDSLDGQLSLFWFQEDDNQFTIDAQDYSFKKEEILCLTSFNKLDISKISPLDI